MNNEKFVNVYIDILQKTLNDWLLQNVSLQANSKVTEETLQEQAETIQNLQVMVANANQEIDGLKEDLKKEKENSSFSNYGKKKSYSDKGHKRSYKRSRSRGRR